MNLKTTRHCYCILKGDMAFFHARNMFARYKIFVAMSATSLVLIIHGMQFINLFKKYNIFSTIGADFDYQLKGELSLIYIKIECIISNKTSDMIFEYEINFLLSS